MYDDYVKDVYAGILGKVIGVYMGRPFEGTFKNRLEERFGTISRYVYEDYDEPLVVPDDDITGTLTFIRALEDSGLYENTPTDFFGATWLNYIIENRSILWWGGVGNSTEHTAFCNLKNGMTAPMSGSMKTNGRFVAEQIGAQIFIDCFGMVCPGHPDLAVELAQRAASVSHDGNAVYAARVVAAMVAAAFVEKDMNKLLDIGVSFIPAESMIAHVHKDVRKWRVWDNDWHKTYDRINHKYGYWRYQNSCHIIPNHAVMVMAWVYAPDSFYESQVIINTAGWDTDCNAANVGSVMGIKVGLERINEDYDFQSVFADRLLIPTAEGSRAVSDVLTESLYVAAIGCRIMGYENAGVTPNEFNFNMPGALHGFMPETDRAEIRGHTHVSNTVLDNGERGMCIHVERLTVGTSARVSTPVLPMYNHGGSYEVLGSPKLYPGMKVEVDGICKNCYGSINIKLFFRHIDGSLSYGELLSVENGKFVIESPVPSCFINTVCDFGFEINGLKYAWADIIITSIRFRGAPSFAVQAAKLPSDYKFLGWTADLNILELSSNADNSFIRLGKNRETGIFVTGTREWSDYSVKADMKVHMAVRGGLIARYQGLKRYIALIRKQNKLQLIKEYYGTTLLAEIELNWPLDDVKQLELKCCGPNIKAFFDGQCLFEQTVPELSNGAAGFLFDKGIIAFSSFTVNP